MVPRVAGITTIFALGASAALGATLGLQRGIIFPRSMAVTEPGVVDRVPGLVSWWHETEAGRVEAWFIPGEGVSSESPGPLVLFAHGNAETIDNWAEALAPYRRSGVSLLLPEYRGYGRSAGRPSQDALVADSLAILEAALERPEVDPARVVYHGRSLGGGVVCALAERRPPQGLILESTFTSLAERAHEITRLPRSWVRDPFHSLSVVEAFEGPVLVIHGTEDTTIPYHHGVKLAEAASYGHLETWEGAGHNDVPREARYWGQVEALLGRAGATVEAMEPAG